MGLNALVVLLLADGSVLAVDLSGHVAATEVAAEECNVTVLKPVPGSGSRAKCAQFRGSSDAKHVSSWFQPWNRNLEPASGR